MKSILTLQGITLKFGGITALQEVTADFQECGIHGVIGPNGAGKSTLFNIITGIYHPTAGKVLFGAREIQKLKATEISRLGITRTFQNIRLLSHLTILENLLVVGACELEGTFLGSLFGLPAAKSASQVIQKRAEALLEMIGLAHLKNQLPGSLPYGEQRKLEIARTLMMKPRLLLLDEPAAGMNPKEKENLSFLLKKVAGQDLTVIVIEHDMRFIMNLCQDILVLNQGSVCSQGTPEQIQNDPKVISTYLGTRSINLKSV